MERTTPQEVRYEALMPHQVQRIQPAAAWVDGRRGRGLVLRGEE